MLMTVSGVLGVAAIAVLALNMAYLRGVKPMLPSAQLTFTEARFRGVTMAWTEEMRRRVLRHFAADYLFIALYAVAGSLDGGSAGPWFSGAVGHFLARWGLLVAAAADAVENVLHQRFLARPTASHHPAWYAVAGSSAATKFALLVTWTLQTLAS